MYWNLRGRLHRDVRMRCVNIKWFFIFCSLLLPTYGLCSPASITLASISQSPKNEIKKLDPLISYIALNLNDPRFKTGKIRVEKDVSKLLIGLRDRKIDLFIGEPFVTSLLYRMGDLRPFLQLPTHKTDKHSALIIVSKNSSIKTLRDLRGKTIAFDNALSSIGYMLPKISLIDKGYRLTFKKPNTPISSDDIYYVFSGANENTLLWVQRGKAEAGAIDSEIFRQQSKDVIQDFRILDKTIPLPPLMISYRSNLSPDLIEKIKNILKKMHQSENGKKILEDLGDAEKFQDIPKSTTDFLLRKQDFLLKEIKY